MGQRLRLGIAGCGDIAGYTAFFARLNLGIQLAACCDISKERAEAFSARYAIRDVFTDYTQMLTEAALDAVYLAVPHHLHAGMLRTALERKLPVLIEKPITRTLAEGLEVCELARQANLPVAVNYQYRYDSGCYALARAVQAGALGEVRYCRVNIPWHREPAYFQGAAWHRTANQAGGGSLITQGSHFLDIVLWACGQPAIHATGRTARRVFQEIEIEDLAMGIVELQNGALIEICSSMASASEQAAVIEIYGSKSTAIYTDRPFPHVRFQGKGRHALAWPARPPVWGIHALQRSIEGFRRWVRGGQAHLVPSTAALPVLAAVEAIYRSAASEQTEPVEIIPSF